MTFSTADQASRHVPNNPRPLCRDFVPKAAPSEFWCATCGWNRPMHDSEEKRAAIAAELTRLTEKDQDDDEEDDTLHACFGRWGGPDCRCFDPDPSEEMAP